MTTRSRKHTLLQLLLPGLAVCAVAALSSPGAATASLAGQPPAPERVDVTLVTGDRISVTPAAVGSDASAVSATPAARPSGEHVSIAITAQHPVSGPDSVFAIPSDAAQLVSAGRIDRGLFDVSYLAAGTGSTAGGTTAVVVQYQRTPSAVRLAELTSAVPGSTVSRSLTTPNAVVVQVPTSAAAAFWSAMTSHAKVTGVPVTSLATGVARMWLSGHRVGSGHPWTTRTDDTFVVTETFKAHRNSQMGLCLIGDQRSLVCPTSWHYLVGMQGDATGQIIQPANIRCVEATNPCKSIEISFVVPEGVYSAHNLLVVQMNSEEQDFEVDQPEFTVSRDTDLTFALNDAHPMTIRAPQPTEPYNAMLETYRSLADGTEQVSILQTSYGLLNFWAMPNKPVSIGSYHLKSNWMLGRPMVTAQVTSPDKLTLHPTYPGYRPGEAAHFSGKHDLPLVAAGRGTMDDFKGVDAKGKLVLLYPPATGCVVAKEPLVNAHRAGAAGVLFDATTDWWEGGYCPLPMLPFWRYTGEPRPPMPFAELPDNEGTALRALLDQGKVRVTVSDPGATPYEDEITLVQQDFVPDDLHYEFTVDQLAHVTERYTASEPILVDFPLANWLPDESFVGSGEYTFGGPRVHELYVGPISPDLVYGRAYYPMTRVSQVPLQNWSRYAVYDEAGDLGVETWGAAPTAPGNPSQPKKAWKAQPGSKFDPFTWCSGCRQDNIFIPITSLTSSDARQADPSTFPGWLPQDVVLYRGAKVVPQTPNDYGVAEYTLPPKKSDYRLVLTTETSKTSWTFESAKPTKDNVPQGYMCPASVFFGLAGPCEASPLVFLRYDAGLDLHNAVTAPGDHTLRVTGYHQAPKTTDVVALKIWTSTDSGKTWQPATVEQRGGGRFVAAYHVPGPDGTSGTVSVKAQAEDAAGNAVTQTMIDAYALTAR